MNGDPSVMIVPGSVAVSSPRVEPELLHHLDVSWQSIIAGDVDGATSTPTRSTAGLRTVLRRPEPRHQLQL
jgi:uncharacterized protein